MCSLAARVPTAAGISLQPFLQQTRDGLSPACHRGMDCVSLLHLEAETARILPEDACGLKAHFAVTLP